MKALDVGDLPGRAKQIAQTDSISDELNGYIEKLSLLVGSLTVCQLAVAVNVGESGLIYYALARLKRCSLLLSR